MGKQMTHDDFIVKLKTKQPEIFNCILYFIDDYVKSNNHIRIKVKHGICRVKPSNLLSGFKPTIRSAIDKTEFFKSTLKHSSPKLYENIIEFVGEYVSEEIPMIVTTKYGECSSTPSSMLNSNYSISINSAINKDEYFKNMVRMNSPRIYNQIESFTSKYNGMKSRIRFMTKYGECELEATLLVHSTNNDITIQSALNKNEYFKNESIEIHGYKYNYSEVNYTNNSTKVCIVCPEHGEFWQDPNGHLLGKGCKSCSNENNNGRFNLSTCETNKDEWDNKKSIFYVIKCYNDEEMFYKIGVTSKENVKKRFYGKNMPYEYDIIFKKVTSFYKAIRTEQYYKLSNKESKYVPKLNFSGRYECFIHIDFEKLNIIFNKQTKK